MIEKINFMKIFCKIIDITPLTSTFNLQPMGKGGGCCCTITHKKNYVARV